MLWSMLCGGRFLHKALFLVHHAVRLGTQSLKALLPAHARGHAHRHIERIDEAAPLLLHGGEERILARARERLVGTYERGELIPADAVGILLPERAGDAGITHLQRPVSLQVPVFIVQRLQKVQVEIIDPQGLVRLCGRKKGFCVAVKGHAVLSAGQLVFIRQLLIIARAARLGGICAGSDV